MDKSNFDIIKCGEYGCDFWHIIITEGFKKTEDAKNEIQKIINGKSFYSHNNFDEQALELLNTIKDDMQEIRSIMSKRPQIMNKQQNR